MRPKFVAIILLFAIGVIAILIWFRPREQASMPNVAPIVQASARTTNSQPGNAPIAAVAPKPRSQPADVSVPMDEATARSNALILREVQMKQAVEGKNVRVLFYGMVIDQDSNALAGVSVSLSVRHNVYVTPGSLEAMKYAALSHDELQKVLSPSIQVTTDGAGRFQWEDADVTGDVLGVGAITKDGYEAEPGQYSCGAGSGNYDNPVIFKMWSTNIHERLITGNKLFDIVPDGRSYFVNLTDGTITESGTGDLKVWIRNTSQAVPGQLYDWSSGIEVVNGGLLEEGLGSPMFQAPTDGYVPTFETHGKIRGGQRGSTGEHQFYLLLKNGQEYGQMTIGLYAPFNNETPGLIRLSYAINPSGSRFLR